MHIFRDIASLRSFLDPLREEKGTIGFVPTMGALHEGHLELVSRAGRENTCSVCSIFVNPTQFNESSDLEKYPRTPEKDAAMLSKVGTDALFMPDVPEIYPPGKDLEVRVDFGMLATVMEGAFRPGHFKGVAMVVHRLLRIVVPDRLYMGEKDFQQLAIVRRMVSELELGVDVVGCPIVREADGLAMSSRNRRLTAQDRLRAPAIYNTLLWARARASSLRPRQLTQGAMQRLEKTGLKPEYFQLVHPQSLAPIGEEDDPALARACVAAWAGEVRLIDNMAMS